MKESEKGASTVDERERGLGDDRLGEVERDDGGVEGIEETARIVRKRDGKIRD